MRTWRPYRTNRASSWNITRTGREGEPQGVGGIGGRSAVMGDVGK